MVLDLIQAILLVLIGGHLLWTVFMHLCTWTYFAGRAPSGRLTTREPTVSIIKPVKGVDQSAITNFRSFCQQDYDADYELLFCVEETSDAAIPVIRQIIADYPGERIRLIFSDPTDSRAFGKTKNMIAGVAASSHEVVVFSDSDAYVPPTFLRETVACTCDPTVGIAFGAPAYGGSEDWPAALTSISVNELTLRIATLHTFGLFDGAIGTTMVTRRRVIEGIGGLEQLGWQIADDIQLARVIRRQGYRVHLLRRPAQVLHHHDSFLGWWSHRHRWSVIIRRYWPLLFILTNLVDLALWWSLLYLGIALFQHSGVPLAIGLILVVLAMALASTATVNIAFAHNRRLWPFIWVVFVQELLRLPLVVYSCVTNEIIWRGRRLRVSPDGTTRFAEAPPAGPRARAGPDGPAAHAP
jgi:ceramide glucosyltransferase